jgi:DNA-binding beta-propeller fold protein YncE
MLAACALFVATAAASQESVLTAPWLGDRFITFPAEAKFPGGVAADPVSGSLFAGTDDIEPDGSGRNFLFRYDMTGRMLAQLPVGLTPVTGIAFNPRDQKVYFARPGAVLGLDSVIQRVPARFNAGTVPELVAKIPKIGSVGTRSDTTHFKQEITISFPSSPPAPKDLRFRASDGALFLTDSLQSAVFKIDNPAVAANTCPANTACVKLVKQDPLLASAGFPQFGLDGLVFSADERTLYLTNIGDRRLLSLRLADNTLAVMTESLEGADGLELGPDNTIIVSRALENDFAVIDPDTGRILAELGAFRGVRADGSVRGFLFPGSFVVMNNVLFANNLALPLSGLPSDPALDVRTYTMSRMVLPAVFPR